MEEDLERERERSKAREQEAFEARYTLVGLQEQLDQAAERAKTLEQERDAFKTLAQNHEEVARIAAEGKLPLPPSEHSQDSHDSQDDNELEAPKKRQRVSSVNFVDIRHSATSEAEIEQLSLLCQWEKQRADRAEAQVEYLEAECHLRCCPAAKTSGRSRASLNRKRSGPAQISDPGDLGILSESGSTSPVAQSAEFRASKRSKTEMIREDQEPRRRSTIFVPTEGIFRTVDEPVSTSLPRSFAASDISGSQAAPSEAPTSPDRMNPRFARTPSIEPPPLREPRMDRTSLLSLLNAPHGQGVPPMTLNIPTVSNPEPSPTTTNTPTSSHSASFPAPSQQQQTRHSITVAKLTRQPYDNKVPPTPTEENYHQQQQEGQEERGRRRRITPERRHQPRTAPIPTTAGFNQSSNSELHIDLNSDPYLRPHTTAAHYPTTTSTLPIRTTTTTTTTTKVPLREETQDPSLAARLMKLQRTPSRGDDGNKPTFDTTNPALTPTMTREEALAQIRERRSRARSVSKGPNGRAVTPGRYREEVKVAVAVGGEPGAGRRDISAQSAPEPMSVKRAGAVTPGPGAYRRIRS